MTISTANVQRFNALEQPAEILTLITIDHEQLDNPLHFVANNENEPVTSQDVFYTAYPVDLLPPSMGEGLPQSSLRIHNVNRKIGVILRQIRTKLQLTLQTVWADDLDNPIETFAGLYLRGIRVDESFVEGTIIDEDMASEPLPWIRCTVDKFQSIHRLQR